MKEESRKLFFTFIVSAVLHIIFFMVLVFAPAHKTRKDLFPSVINVSMVALPGPEKAPKQGDINGFVLEKKSAKPAKPVKSEKPAKPVQSCMPWDGPSILSGPRISVPWP